MVVFVALDWSAEVDVFEFASTADVPLETIDSFTPITSSVFKGDSATSDFSLGKLGALKEAGVIGGGGGSDCERVGAVEGREEEGDVFSTPPPPPPPTTSSAAAIEGHGLEAPLAARSPSQTDMTEGQGLTDRDSPSIKKTPLPVGTGLLPEASLFLMGALCTRRFNFRDDEDDVDEDAGTAAGGGATSTAAKGAPDSRETFDAECAKAETGGDGSRCW